MHACLNPCLEQHAEDKHAVHCSMSSMTFPLLSSSFGCIAKFGERVRCQKTSRPHTATTSDTEQGSPACRWAITYASCEGEAGMRRLARVAYEAALAHYMDDSKRRIALHGERRNPPIELSVRTAFKVLAGHVGPCQVMLGSTWQDRLNQTNHTKKGLSVVCGSEPTHHLTSREHAPSHA